jgi:exonuclease III
MKNKSKIKIIEWNCYSLRSKLNQFIRSHKPDILPLNETKCSLEVARF